MNESFLTYRFGAFKFEFIRDDLFITNEVTRIKYRVQFDPYNRELPFVIILEEKL